MLHGRAEVITLLEKTVPSSMLENGYRPIVETLIPMSVKFLRAILRNLVHHLSDVKIVNEALITCREPIVM